MLRRRPTDLIQSLSRGLRILEEVGGTPGGLNAKEIARRCELGRPTANRLLRTLCYEGYLLRRDNGNYVPGLEIAGRYRDLVAALERPPNVHEVLRHLSQSTGHTAYFSQVVGDRIVITDVFEGPKSPHLEDLVVGFDEGAHATALGKALLSTLPSPDRRAYLRDQGLRPFTGNTIVDPDELDYELRSAAPTKMFTEQGQFRPEVCCGAVLVPRVKGTIGLSAGARRWDGFGSALMHELRLRAADLS